VSSKQDRHFDKEREHEILNEENKEIHKDLLDYIEYDEVHENSRYIGMVKLTCQVYDNEGRELTDREVTIEVAGGPSVDMETIDIVCKALGWKATEEAYAKLNKYNKSNGG